MTETIFGKNLFDVYLISFAHVPLANMEGAGFMTYSTTSHQWTIKMFWVHFWGAVYLYTVNGAAVGDVEVTGGVDGMELLGEVKGSCATPLSTVSRSSMKCHYLPLPAIR